VDRFGFDFLRTTHAGAAAPTVAAARAPRNASSTSSGNVGRARTWAGFADGVWEARHRFLDGIPKATLTQLVPQLRALRQRFEALQDSIETRAVPPAEIRSRLSALLVATSSFAELTQSEITSARVAMGCCALAHSVEIPLAPLGQLLLGLLALGAVAAVGLRCVAPKGGAVKASGRQQRVHL
jgi:hypothetical protein